MDAASVLSIIDSTDNTKLISGLKARVHLDVLDAEWFAERLQFERDGLRVVVDRRPAALYDQDGNVVGFDLYIRAYQRGREYRLDPHRQFINPPLVLADTREINPLAVCEEILFDSIRQARNKKAWRTSGTVTTVFAAANQWGQSCGASYATAHTLSGNFTGDATTLFRLVMGQYYNGTNLYCCLEAAIGFDVSAITDASINKVDLMLYNDGVALSYDFVIDVAEHDYGASPTGATMVSGADLPSLTVIGTLTASTIPAGYATFTENSNLLQKSVQRFAGLGTAKYVFYGANTASNTAATAFEYFQCKSVETAGTTQDPKLVITSSAVYHVPAGLIVAWTGTNAAIPSGWTRVTGLDSAYPKGSTAAGSTGGANTHTHVDTAHTHAQSHTHGSVTSGNRAGGVNANFAGTGTTISNAGHSHTVTFNASADASASGSAGSSSSSDTQPSYYNVIWIKADGTTDIPSGCVAFWGGATTTIPTNWQYANGTGVTVDLRSKFLRGAAAAGDSGAGGAGSHTHTATHSHAAAGHVHTAGVSAATSTAVAGAGAVAREPVATNHHTVAPTYGSTSSALDADGTVSASASPEPPWTKLHHIWKTASSAVIPIGLIAMWDGPAASIPPDWVSCDGTNSTPNINGGSNHFVKGTAANGEQATTGGAATHTHTLAHTHGTPAHTHGNSAGISGSSTSAVFNGSVSNLVLQNHTHTAPTSGIALGVSGSGSDTLTAASSEPAYSTVLFIQRKSINTAVTPGVTALATNRFAPVVTVGAGNITAIPSTASLATNRFAPVVSTPRRAEPTTKALVTATFAPVVSTPRLVTPGHAELVTAAFAPDVSIGVRSTPDTIALLLTTFPPGVLTPVRVEPSTLALALTPFAPDVFTPVRVEPAAGALLLATFAPIVATPRRTQPTTAALLLTPFAPLVVTPRLVVPSAAGLVLTPHAPDVLTPRTATPETATLETVLFPPDIVIGYRATPQTAALVTARFAPIVLTPVTATPDTALLELTSFPPDVDLTLRIVVAVARLRTKGFLAQVHATDIPVYHPGDYWPPRRNTTLWGIEEADIASRSTHET